MKYSCKLRSDCIFSDKHFVLGLSIVLVYSSYTDLIRSTIWFGLFLSFSKQECYLLKRSPQISTCNRKTKIINLRFFVKIHECSETRNKPTDGRVIAGELRIRWIKIFRNRISQKKLCFKFSAGWKSVIFVVNNIIQKVLIVEKTINTNVRTFLYIIDAIYKWYLIAKFLEFGNFGV